MCAVFETADAQYECSPEDISILGFTFRIPPEWRTAIFTCRQVVIHFYYPSRMQAVILPASAYTVTVEAEEPYLSRLRLETGRNEYTQAARLLISDISTYTEMKTDLEMPELSEKRLGYPAVKEQCFSSSVSAQLSSWLSSVHPDTGWSQEHYSAALCLTEPGQILSYLTHSGPTFPEPYASFSHPIMQHVDTVYFGSMSCPFLIPAADVLLDACAKAADENLHPVLALPPVMSLDFERIQHLLDQILPRLPKHQELSVNDWGLIRYIHAHYPSAVIELGPLLNRSTRDVRLPYLHREPPQEPSFHADAWKRHLSDLGITRASSQCQEQTIPPLSLPFSLFLPFFQMNTSLQCTLRCALETGSRGGQPSSRLQCSRPCTSYAFLYPDFLHMTGRQNALYGYDRKALSDFDYVRANMGNTCDRIVLNLFR